MRVTARPERTRSHAEHTSGGVMLQPFSLGARRPRSASTVAVIHPDERLLDLLQFALEAHGLATTALVPEPAAGVRGLQRYLVPPPQVCVVGLCPPYASAKTLLTELRHAVPGCLFLLTAANPV